MKIEAYAHVVYYNADEPSTKIPLEPSRVLFEESCIIYGFKPIRLGACEVIGVEVDGESAKCSYKLKAGDTFLPGMKYYYPTTVAQCGKSSPAEEPEVTQDGQEDDRR